MKGFDLRFAAATFAVGLGIILWFTPWEHTISKPGAATVERPAPHSPITSPPETIDPMYHHYGVRIDRDRLAIYLLLTLGASIFVGTLNLRE